MYLTKMYIMHYLESLYTSDRNERRGATELIMATIGRREFVVSDTKRSLSGRHVCASMCHVSHARVILMVELQ